MSTTPSDLVAALPTKNSPVDQEEKNPLSSIDLKKELNVKKDMENGSINECNK